MTSFRGSSQPRDWTQVSYPADRFFTNRATRDLKISNFFDTWTSFKGEVGILQLFYLLNIYQVCCPLKVLDLRSGSWGLWWLWESMATWKCELWGIMVSVPDSILGDESFHWKQRKNISGRGTAKTSRLEKAWHTGEWKESCGLPWWLSGKESACQCRGLGLDPRSGKIPRAAGWLSPSTATTEPVF